MSPARTVLARRTVLALACLLPLAACGEANMTEQPNAKPWDKSDYFADKMTMREPVAGTVPRVDPGRELPQPVTITQALLDRGRERYGIFCAPCHGRSGNGRGMIVERGFPHAGLLTSARLSAAPAAEIYRSIGQGHRTMFGMAQMIPSADRWAITAYVRALQRSQDAEVAGLPPEDRSKLEATQ